MARAPQPHQPEVSDKPTVSAPISGYVRDAIAAMALLWALSMPWDYSGDAVDKVYVVLATLLSLASLTLLHLLRLGVAPSTWGLDSVRSARRVLNAPYFLVVLAALVFDGLQDKGVGPAIGVGLAGAVLATVGREAELPAGSDAPLWRRVAIVLGLLGLLQCAVGLGYFFKELFEYGPMNYGIDSIIAVLANYAFLFVVGGAPFLALFRRDTAWRYVLLGAGAVCALVNMWPMEPRYELDFTVGRLHDGSALLLLWPAVAAAAAAAGLRGVEHFVADHELWFRTAADVLLLGALAESALVVRDLAVLSLLRGGGTDSLGEIGDGSDYIVRAAIQLALVALALVARGSLLRNGHGGRRTAFVVAVGYLVGGTVLVLMSDGWFESGMLSRLIGLVPYAVSVAMLALLAIPAAAREPQSSPTAPGWSAPPFAAAGPSAGGPSPVGADARWAADPSAPPAVLTELAANRPDLHIFIASNPSAWPELLDWIRQYGHPEAQQYLRGRQQHGD